MNRINKWVGIGALLANCSLALPVGASQAGGLGFGAALSERALDALRGGFITEGGLQLTFGLEHVLMVNGELEAHTVLVPEFNLTSGFSAGDLPVPAEPTVIQLGAGNAVSGDVLPNLSSMTTIIQNSLDHQTIQGLGIYNIGISNLSALRAREFGALIHQQLLDSIHP